MKKYIYFNRETKIQGTLEAESMLIDQHSIVMIGQCSEVIAHFPNSFVIAEENILNSD